MIYEIDILVFLTVTAIPVSLSSKWVLLGCIFKAEQKKAIFSIFYPKSAFVFV